MATDEPALIRGSERPPPPGDRIGRTPGNTPIEVQVYLRAARPPKLSLAPGALQDPATRPTREALGSARAIALDRSFRTVERFATHHGLAVVQREPARRVIRLAGSAAALEAAFGTELHEYRDGETSFRARSGPLRVDKAMARVTQSVLGLGTRPFVQPLLGTLGPPTADDGHLPSAFATLYDFPQTPGHGAGQSIALIQAGGQYYPGDTAAAFAAMDMAAPTVVPISVSGAIQSPQFTLDQEIALDVQVAGAVAPQAILLLYFASAGIGGFVDAVSQAVHDQVHRPTILLISFGRVEGSWPPDALAALSAVFADAAHLGITVTAATGDLLASAGYFQALNVQYPASDPHVLACGGTTLRTDAAGNDYEAAWKANTADGTGGGISTLWARPNYQSKANLPPHPDSGKPMRGIPDVAGVADEAPGYRICCRGNWQVAGGTSAVAPLWAGLIARVNEGKGVTAGFINPILYGAPQAFNDVIEGDNLVDGGNDTLIGYRAQPGWDGCTGLGSPRGTAIYNLF